MDLKKEVKSLLNQAEVFNSQGLLREAKDKYIQAGKLVKSNAKIISNHKSLLNSIVQKIALLKKEIHKVEKEPPVREIPEQVQNIIKEKFAFAKDKNLAELEGAIALAKFGQYERAIEELRKLLKKKRLRINAAKNIFRCYKALDSLNDAVKVFRHWTDTDIFSYDELLKLRVFLKNILKKKGIKADLPRIKEKKPEEEMENLHASVHDMQTNEEDVLDISSVGITLNDGPSREKIYEYDVSFQSGNVINLLVSGNDKKFLENLKEDNILEKVQFFSPIAMFEGKAAVVSKSQIESGPKKGHFSVDIKIMSI